MFKNAALVEGRRKHFSVWSVCTGMLQKIFVRYAYCRLFVLQTAVCEASFHILFFVWKGNCQKLLVVLDLSILS